MVRVTAGPTVGVTVPAAGRLASATTAISIAITATTASGRVALVTA